MKKILHVLLCLTFAATLHAQSPAPTTTNQYSPEQLDELAAPIALYPDALIAIILPAATAPGDIVLAARYLAANNDPAQIPNQPWDDSVKALANYPEVIQWMDDNLDWSTALGQAFLLQPTQVMESVQQLRALARANGTLVDTPQQKVVLDGSNILIVPTDNDSISIPEYDPDLAFSDQPVVYSTPVIYFSQPYLVGPWLSFECDWDDFGIWRGTWIPGWTYIRPWRDSRRGADVGRFWQPDPARRRESQRAINRPVQTPPHPRPMAKAPNVEQRPAQGFRPGVTNPPSRPDPTGWRTDSTGRLAVPPRANQPTGAKVLTTPSTNAPANRPAPQNRAPDLSEIRPQGSTPAQPVRPAATTSASARQNRPADITEIHPQGSAPEVSTSPQKPRTNNPPSAGLTTRPQAIPAQPAAPGPAFGSYTRGTTAQDYSNRGQASRAAATPPPPAPRPAPPTSRPAPAAPPPRVAEPPPAAPDKGVIKRP